MDRFEDNKIGVAKMPTGLDAFDQITHGGLPRGRTTLVAGGPGCGKTVFALDILDEPLRAVRDRLLVTPTLSWTLGSPSPSSVPLGSPSPSSVQGLIPGDLSEQQRVLDALGLAGGQL